MTVYNRNIALVVEGVGSSTSSTGGIAWHFGPSTISTPGTYEWIGGSGSGEGLVGPPESVGCSVDPFACELRGNAHTFEIHATSQAKALFLRRPQNARDSLSTEIDEDATTLAFDGVGYTWSSSDDGTVVWIGDEAILLGTYAAGPQFTGCTRAMWSTTAQTQPAGMNIYAHNPKIVNRYCKLLVYDRDAGTTTQAWQGFVQKPTIDGPIIRIPAQDIWSVVVGAEVNRKAPRPTSRLGSTSVRSAVEITNGTLLRGVHTPRVNKSNATSPHWMSIQVGGALFYGSYNSTTSVLSFTDDGVASSFAQLDSVLEDDDPRYFHEVLAVQRVRDESGGNLAALGARRSSTRDLDEPFHPVSISMALLTSGYGTYPQGAAPQTVPGDNIAIENSGPVQYFTSGDQAITVMNARNLTGQCLIARNLGSSSAPHYHLINDAISQVWVMDSSNLYSTVGRPDGSYIYEDGSYCVVGVDGSDGVTYGSAGNVLIMRLDMTDGSQNWVQNLTATGGGIATAFLSVAGLDADETNDRLLVDCNYGGDEIRMLTLSTGAEQAVSANDTGLGTGVTTLCLTPDKTKMCVIGGGATPEYGAYTMPLSGLASNWIGYSTNDLQLDGTDSTNDLGYVTNLDYCGRVIPARATGSNKVYVCAGVFGSNDNRYVMRIDPDSGSYGAVDAEVDVAADADFTPGTYNFVLDIQCDQYGYVYCLVTNAATSGDWDVVRYDADLTNPFSFSFDGGVTMPSIATYGYPTRLAVDENDSVFVGTRTGYVTRFSQTA